MAIIKPFASRCTIVTSNDESRFVFVCLQLDDQNCPLYVVEDERYSSQPHLTAVVRKNQ